MHDFRTNVSFVLQNVRCILNPSAAVFVCKGLHRRDLTCRINFRTFRLNLLFVTSICSVFFALLCFSFLFFWVLCVCMCVRTSTPFVRQFYVCVFFQRFFLLNTFYHDMRAYVLVSLKAQWEQYVYVCIVEYSFADFFLHSHSHFRCFIAAKYTFQLWVLSTKILLQLVQGINSSRFDF